MSRSTTARKINRNRDLLTTVDESTKVWLTIGNVDTFRLAVVASWRDSDAIDEDGFGEEAQNVERLIAATALTLDVDVDEVYDNIAGRLWGMEHATSCVRCGDEDYAPTCPSCVLDAGCAIG